LTASIEDYSFFAQRISLRLYGGPSGISPCDGWPFQVSFYPLREFLVGQTFSDVICIILCRISLLQIAFQPLVSTTLVPALDVAAGNR